MTSRSPDVLAAVDGSWPSAAALDWAAADAAALGTGLTVCIVVAAPGADPELCFARKVVDSAIERARSVAPGVPVRGTVAVGAPGPELARLARQEVELVLGASGLGGSPRLGLVSDYATAHAPVPVVVVRPVPPGARTVVVGVDGHLHTDGALDHAFHHAARHGLDVRALYGYSARALVPAVPATGWVVPDGGGLTAEHLVRDQLDRWAGRFPDVPAEAAAVEGSAAAVLSAASAMAALVVVGGPADPFADSVGTRLARHASCPVALVPPG